MKDLTLEKITAAVKGAYLGGANLLAQEITAVTADSRAVTPGCLFAAIRGERSDGHDYIAAAAEKGALCALCERKPTGEAPLPLILVENTVTALGDLAAVYRRQFDIPVLGVTGSVGKTTAKEMIAAVLAQRLRVHRTQGNFNNDLGVPLTLFGLDETHEAAVIEMGISHFGEMRRLAEIVRPGMALYTAIGSAHLEFLGDFGGVLRAKTEMLELLPEDGVVFVNGDDETLRRLSCRQRLVRFGLSPDCTVRGENVRPLGTEGTALEIVAEGRRIPAHINAFGGHLATAALGAAAVGLELGLTDAEIAAGLAAYVPVGSRSGLIQTDKITIIDDCYNANPSSVAAALDSLSELPARRVSILGDMGELGETAERLHFETGVHAAEKGIELIVACGALSRSTAEGAERAGGKAVYFAEKEALLAALPGLIEAGDAVLVKASHSRKFEDVVEALKTL